MMMYEIVSIGSLTYGSGGPVLVLFVVDSVDSGDQRDTMQPSMSGNLSGIRA